MPQSLIEELDANLARGHETDGVEFKSAGPRGNRDLLAGVIQAMLAMANRAYGGVVYVGVNNACQIVPLTEDDAKTWGHDDIASVVRTYADPHVSFESGILEHPSGLVLRIRVQEFDDVPVLCRKDGGKKLREGRLYIRSRRKPETTWNPDHAQLRDLLQRAGLKTARRLIAESRALGLVREGPGDDGSFQEEIADLGAGSETLVKIRTRGYWRFLLRPADFVHDRIATHIELENLVDEIRVEFRGLNFPNVDREPPPTRGAGYIEQELDWERHLEFWRFTESGQFVCFRAVTEDWAPAAERPQESLPSLGVYESLYLLTEAFECAARLASSGEGTATLRVEITLEGAQGRSLHIENSPSPMVRGTRPAAVTCCPYRNDIDRPELIGNTRELALEAASNLFSYFHFDPSADLLRDWQGRLWR